MSKSTNQKATPRTRQAILNLLKREGAMDSQTLADYLQVSAMAIRQHLYAMQDERLVTYQEQLRAMGRPAKLWQLTPEADCFFPDGYAELTLGLLESVLEAFGNQGLEKLLEVRTRHQINAYRSAIPPETDLKEKIELIAQIRTNEGYMAEIQPFDPDAWLLIENHCPICAAATACTGLCAQELEVFQAVLGQGITVERTEHIIAGARRCAYLVRKI
jgi:predicted ArsR family transcriptional regulator